MTKKLKTLIVDDERSARENLKILLNEFCKNIHIVDEANNVDKALSMLNQNDIDLLFLDIEMPNKNGFELLEEIPTNSNIEIIFITAYDNYAIKAFEVSASDYLLKPITISRLQKAVQKVQERIFLKKKHQLFLLKSNLKKVSKLSIPFKSGHVVIEIKDIVSIEADRMYVNIYTNNQQKYIVSKKLSYYEKLLSSEQFMRVHRSWIVNENMILLFSKSKNELTLKNQQIIPVSKTYKEDVIYTIGLNT